ncbi:MAG: tyrosine--tRNA ligase [Coriobacteriaceae bacterium]|nr:tyrosine--tRNA ligase [Coriobacteriaceae bacterium]
MISVDEQLHIITSGTVDLIPVDEMKKKLERDKPLTVKLGVDPTSPDLHIGHAVPLRKLRQFQDLGHEVVLIIGDGTALIGDPSGRNSTRPQLTEEQIEQNAQTYVSQAMKILDPDHTTIRHNSEWIFDLDLAELLKLLSNFTVARILERDDFSNRYHAQTPIALHEFLYPVMQAYDSVVIEADVEIGGSDQLFNLLAGRELMEKLGMEPQCCLTLPLLEGTDGVRKMSKSYGNYIGLTDEPADMFGKVMSISDEMMPRYFRLATALPVAEIDDVEAGLADGSLDPNQTKRRLGREIVAAYYDADAAAAAEAAFDRQFKEHEAPADIEEFSVDLSEDADAGGVYLPKVLVACKLVSSNGEGRRMIDGGGVKIDGKPLEPETYHVAAADLQGAVLQVGKRKWARLI